jgi:arylsulfatase A-like enzyme
VRVWAILISLVLLGGFVLMREVQSPSGSPDGLSAAERPNILIIMTDDQRASADGLSVMKETRRIFGREGTKFTNAVATTPLCCPSRTSIFSGRYSHNTGVRGLDPARFDQTTTLQHHLQRQGYLTAMTGKYLNNFKGRPPHFDYADEGVGYYTKEGIQSRYYNEKRVYSTHHIRDKALTYLDKFEATDNDPWLMYVHPLAPHSPAKPETKYANAFVPPWELNPARSESDRRDKPKHVREVRYGAKETVDLRERQIRTLYSVDDLVVKVFDRLETLGEDEDTLAFFLSDNGFIWMEHKLGLKNYAYDDAVNIPFYMRWPGHVEEGAVDDRIVANIDIAPTIYDIIDYTPNHTLDGRSIFTSNRSEILTEGSGHGMRFKALWNPDWMYVEHKNGFREFYGPGDPWQLENGFRTGNPPSNTAQLAARLRSTSSCAGTACP